MTIYYLMLSPLFLFFGILNLYVYFVSDEEHTRTRALNTFYSFLILSWCATIMSKLQ